MNTTRYVYKIVSTPPAPNSPKLELLQIDKDSGFIHLSSGRQVPNTCDRFFSDVATLYIIKFSHEKLADHMKWERAPDSDGVFPHYYGDILMRDADSFREFHKGEASWVSVLDNEAWLSDTDRK